MTREEFRGWMAVTKKSQHRWALDLVSLANRGVYLFYHGGIDGKFIEVMPDGLVYWGKYEGAMPHIGEATFKTDTTKKFSSQGVALEALYVEAPQLRSKEMS